MNRPLLHLYGAGKVSIPCHRLSKVEGIGTVSHEGLIVLNRLNSTVVDYAGTTE